MSTDWSESIVIAELTDEPAFSEEVNALIERVETEDEARVPHLVLNLAQVTYLNSSNIAQLLRLHKRLGRCGRTLKLCSLADEVWTLMLATGLDKVFRFAPDPLTALAGLQLEEAEDAGSA
jgi:anti-anti-sigma factor